MTEGCFRSSHVLRSTDTGQGGLARSVPALVRALNSVGVPSQLGHAASPSDLIHIHGLWLPMHYSAAAAARRWETPYLISPRGMLERWALNHRRWKKRLAWPLYQRDDLARASALHATSESEAESIRRVGLRAPIAVIPNGVDVPHDLPPRLRGERRRALFLSRLHPVKGLPMLLDAWAAVRPAGWELVVAGPDEGGYRARVEDHIQILGLRASVTLVGAVEDRDKWALYRTADLVVLPSHSENFGLVVAEALGAGVPVLTTKGTPWRELEAYRCGWWTDISVDGIAGALSDATQRPRAELDEMGERGRALVLEQYGWNDVGRHMKSVYAWVLSGGERPECVLLEKPPVGRRRTFRQT